MTTAAVHAHCAQCGTAVAVHTGWFAGPSDIAWQACPCVPVGTPSPALWLMARRLVVRAAAHHPGRCAAHPPRVGDDWCDGSCLGKPCATCGAKAGQPCTTDCEESAS